MESNHSDLPRRTPENSSGDVARVLSKLRDQGGDLTINRILANSSRLFRPYAILTGAVVTQSALPRTTFEIVVLAVARALESDYEWAEHVRMASEQGVTQRQIDVLAQQGEIGEPDFNLEQQLAVTFARSLVKEHSVARELWTRCHKELGDDGLVELLIVVAVYGGLVRVILDGLGLSQPD